MCKCTRINDRAVIVKVPAFVELRFNTPEQEKREYVSIDVCLVEEIWELWRKGIVTTGCCCNHNIKPQDRNPAYIGVREDFIDAMRKLGYKTLIRPDCPNRFDSFIPKSLN